MIVLVKIRLISNNNNANIPILKIYKIQREDGDRIECDDIISAIVIAKDVRSAYRLVENIFKFDMNDDLIKIIDIGISYSRMTRIISVNYGDGCELKCGGV